MIHIGSGMTRHVYALGQRYVLKLPRVDRWTRFLYGLLGNTHEAELGKLGWPELCPVTAALPLGLAVVARRAESTVDGRPPTLEEIGIVCDTAASAGRLVGSLAERKPDSWGWVDGRLVAVDYG